MKFVKVYGHFAACYGTFWFVLLLAALVTQSHLDAGAFGFFGFPIIAIIYAVIRMFMNRQGNEMQTLKERIARLESDGHPEQPGEKPNWEP